MDSALWDLEAKRTWRTAGIQKMRPVVTAVTIGIRSEAAYESAAQRYAANPILKIKVDGSDPLAALRAVRRGAPNAGLIVDPNQSWSVDQLKALGQRAVPAGNAYVSRSMIGAVVGVQPFGGEGLSGTGPKAGGPNALLRYAVERALSVNITAQSGDPALLNLDL
jgi:hypothetical protein